MTIPFTQLFQQSFPELNRKNTGFVDLNDEIQHLNQIIWRSKMSGFDLSQAQEYSVHQVLETIVTLGISIDPQKKLAFIAGEVDIYNNPVIKMHVGYRGEIALATQFNIIKSASANLVFENDEFKSFGANKEVEHVITSLSTTLRGQCSGGYCRSVLGNGDILNATLSIEEMDAIAVSQIEHTMGNTAWNSVWCNEMRKVAIYRRAAKDWRQRLYANPALKHSLNYTDAA
ncbi:recombinase RecT [Shewanella frigidimarina]|uniref:recombinase RecT n=1 Tax=Shewanella frigidimarina TaxID=56812 RepID=UPI003D7B5605